VTVAVRERAAFERAVVRVVDSGNCTGCGACTLLDAGLTMRLDGAGFARPARVGESTPSPDALRRFKAMCPGVVVRAVTPAGTKRHPTMGSYLGVWRAWAADPELRLRGSSGGVLTALSSWLVETGEVPSVISAGASKSDPRRTVSVSITTRAEALEAAGSRYAPVAPAGEAGRGGDQAGDGSGDGSAVVGKPCEITALRALHASSPGDRVEPLRFSFFCAGTPSQSATTALLADLGVGPDRHVDELWYRGRGWPGSFTAITDGERVEATYDRSWGQFLGPTMQWRCKICPDGVGESSDVTAADFWTTDERGYPDFAEGPGYSALIARTERGLDVIERARLAGVIVTEPISMDDVAAIQPFQRSRREQLFGRLVGARVAGQPVPRYRGFGLLRLSLQRPRTTVRTLRGSFRRVRAARRKVVR
jgi:coenzyme F420 hydrogenase subunit beta